MCFNSHNSNQMKKKKQKQKWEHKEKWMEGCMSWQMDRKAGKNIFVVKYILVDKDVLVEREENTVSFSVWHFENI